MTSKEYDRISLLYQFLTKRFHVNQDYQYDGYYKCYNPKYYGVREENLQTLEHFENLSYKDLFTKGYINSKPFGEDYLNAKLVKIEEKRICAQTELGQILLYLLVSKLENSIKEFLSFLESLKEKKLGLIKEREEGKMYIISLNDFNRLQPVLEKIENFRFTFHLLAKTNSGFILRDWNENLEIHINKINDLIVTLKNFDFTKVEL